MKNEFVNELYKNIFSISSIFKLLLGLIILSILSFGYFIFSNNYFINIEYLFIFLIIILIGFLIITRTKNFKDNGLIANPPVVIIEKYYGLENKKKTIFHFVRTPVIILIVIIIALIPVLLKYMSILSNIIDISYLILILFLIVYVILNFYLIYLKFYPIYIEEKKKKKKKK